jgi:hypothetical protein
MISLLGPRFSGVHKLTSKKLSLATLEKRLNNLDPRTYQKLVTNLKDNQSNPEDLLYLHIDGNLIVINGAEGHLLALGSNKAGKNFQQETGGVLSVFLPSGKKTQLHMLAKQDKPLIGKLEYTGPQEDGLETIFWNAFFKKVNIEETNYDTLNVRSSTDSNLEKVRTNDQTAKLKRRSTN